MSWRIKMKTRKAPPGMAEVAPALEDFETRTRAALNTPLDDKRRNEISWPMHRLHYEKNRYLFDMHYKHRRVSKKLLDYLAKAKIADGNLMAKWRRPGYERLCSLLVITKSNTNFGTTGVCRIPLKQRTGQIMPNVLTGCVSCASGDGGPIWWDDPVPDVVKERIAEIDPGKADLVQGVEREGEDEREGEGERKRKAGENAGGVAHEEEEGLAQDGKLAHDVEQAHAEDEEHLRGAKNPQVE